MAYDYFQLLGNTRVSVIKRSPNSYGQSLNKGVNCQIPMVRYRSFWVEYDEKFNVWVVFSLKGKEILYKAPGLKYAKRYVDATIDLQQKIERRKKFDEYMATRRAKSWFDPRFKRSKFKVKLPTKKDIEKFGQYFDEYFNKRMVTNEGAAIKSEVPEGLIRILRTGHNRDLGFVLLVLKVIKSFNIPTNIILESVYGRDMMDLTEKEMKTGVPELESEFYGLKMNKEQPTQLEGDEIITEDLLEEEVLTEEDFQDEDDEDWEEA